jgi:hypothetical protein
MSGRHPRKFQAQFNLRKVTRDMWIGGIGTVYDYDRQAWTVDGRYVDCNHPAGVCNCYGRAHAGEKAPNLRGDPPWKTLD